MSAWRDVGDAFHVDVVGRDLGAEGKAGQDRQLVGGVVALDVEGRIGLGVAEALRILQAGLEGQALGLHAGQDVVAGAVEDAEDARRRVLPAIASRIVLMIGNAAGDRRLVVEQHALASRRSRPAPRHAWPAAPCWRSRHACRPRAPPSRRPAPGRRRRRSVRRRRRCRRSRPARPDRRTRWPRRDRRRGRASGRGPRPRSRRCRGRTGG